MSASTALAERIIPDTALTVDRWPWTDLIETVETVETTERQSLGGGAVIVNKTEIAAVQHEVDLHKAALERMGDEGHCSDFEIDFQAGMVAGLERGLRVARSARR